MDAVLAAGSPVVPPNKQELADIAKAMEELPADGVYLPRDLTVIPPVYDNVLAAFERFQARALSAMTGRTLHGIDAPDSDTKPQAVLTAAQLLRQLPGLVQLSPATVAAMLGSPLNAHWPGNRVDRAELLGTLQTGVNQIRLTQPGGPGHKLKLGNGPRGTTNEVGYFNLHHDTDLNELHDSFDCLDAIRLPGKTGDTSPRFISIKHRIGKDNLKRYLRDVQGLVANLGGCASKAAARFDALAEEGRSPLTGECAKATLDCIMHNSTLAVPTDHVQELRAALIKELDGTNGINYKRYGPFTEPLTHQEAVDKANQWVSDTGLHSSLARYA